MASHSNPERIISQIQLPNNGGLYDICDKKAFHTLAEISAAGVQLENALIYKGSVQNMTALNAITGQRVGDIYHVVDIDSEFVWEITGSDTTGHWEEFGSKFAVNHNHTWSGSLTNGTATVTGTNSASKVSGTVTHETESKTATHNLTAAAQTWTQKTGSINSGATVTVTGTNTESDVSVTGSITVPTITETAKYLKVTPTSDTFVKSYPGATSKMVTTSVKGVSGTTTVSKATAQNAVAVATTDTAVKVATRASSQTTVGNANVGNATTVATGVTGGSQATWTANVSNEILSFTFVPNTLQSASTTSITPAVTSTTKIYGVGGVTDITPAKANGTITPYEFDDVTVATAAANATTVATGSLNANGGGATVMTGLGTASIGSALTSATLGAGTSTDVYSGDSVNIVPSEKTIVSTGKAEPQTWTQASGTVTGGVTVTGTNVGSSLNGSIQVTVPKATGTIDATAAAQTWTQKTGTVSGSVGGTTSEPKVTS